MPIAQSKATLALLISAALIAGCNDDDNKTSPVIQSSASEASSSAAATSSSSVAAEVVEVSLRLMETTDIHANVMDYNYYSGQTDTKIGLVRTASLIHQARDELSEPGGTN